MIRRHRVAVVAATAATIMAVGAAPAAAAQINQVAVTVGNGDVECRSIIQDGKTYTNCISATAASHRNHAECNPPEQLVPSVRMDAGNTTVGCWNQGYDGPRRHLGSPGITTHGDILYFADFSGGLHAMNLTGQYAYAGPQGVSDRFNPARLSSF